LSAQQQRRASKRKHVAPNANPSVEQARDHGPVTSFEQFCDIMKAFVAHLYSEMTNFQGDFTPHFVYVDGKGGLHHEICDFANDDRKKQLFLDTFIPLVIQETRLVMGAVLCCAWSGSTKNGRPEQGPARLEVAVISAFQLGEDRVFVGNVQRSKNAPAIVSSWIENNRCDGLFVGLSRLLEAGAV